MQKIIILFFSFFLLVSCGNNQNTQITQTKTSTETTTQQTNQSNASMYLAPHANIEVEDENEINGISFSISTRFDPTYTNILHNEANAENKTMLQGYVPNIIENFSEFATNPTSDTSTGNIAVVNALVYNLSNTIYNPNLPDNKKINQEKTKLGLGFVQNYNASYTGSIWDLPLISLYCEYCFEAGQKADEVIIARKVENTQNNLFSMEKVVNGQNGLLASTPMTSIDATYNTIPSSIVYDLNSEKLADIFKILKNPKKSENNFDITLFLPVSHSIKEVFYEYNNEKKIIADNMTTDTIYINNQEYTKNTITLTTLSELLNNESGKIIVNISEK